MRRSRRAVLAAGLTGVVVAASTVTATASISPVPPPGTPVVPVPALPALAPGGALFDAPGTYRYVVPPGVTRVIVTATGGAGAGAGGAPGGRAARVRSELPVTAGEVLHAVVGSSATGTAPGANGGGAVAACARAAGAGGGASDIRRVAPGMPGSAASRVVVAGGGGGSGAPGPNGLSSVAGPGGARDEVGRNGVTASGQTVRSGAAAGGNLGADGAPGGTGTRSGTAETGGPGAPQVSATAGCGGGGGGGFGGGAGGSSAPGTGGGGAGGGGGSRVADGSRWGLPAPADAVPSVTIDPMPAPAATLRVTPAARVGLFARANGPSSLSFCGAATPRGEQSPCSPRGGGFQFDAGWASQLTWGTASQVASYRSQAGAGLNAARPVTPVELGVPFPIADFVHWNVQISGGSPTLLELRARLEVRPPGGEPVLLETGTPSGETPTTTITFLETENAATLEGCDPAIQRSATPCDDRFELRTDETPTAPQVVRGVTWRVTLLGWDDGAGGVSTSLTTEEGRETSARFVARIDVDTGPTTTTLSSADGALTVQVAPTPSTGGTVAFRDGAAPIAGCEAVPVDTTTGTASCPTPRLALGDRQVTAAYSGGVGFAPSTSEPVTVPGTVPPVVVPPIVTPPTSAPPTSTTKPVPGKPAATRTALVVVPGPAVPQGTPVALIAVVAPATAGTVRFRDGSEDLGRPVPVDPRTGRASTVVVATDVGDHPVTATFTPLDPARAVPSTSSPVVRRVTDGGPPGRTAAAVQQRSGLPPL